MKVVGIDTKGIRGLGEISVSFANRRDGKPMPAVLITGGPASGKTSLLQAVTWAHASVEGLCPLPAATILDDAVASGRLRARWQLSAEEQQAAKFETPVAETTWHVGRDVAASVDGSLRLLFMAQGPWHGQTSLECVSASRRVTVDRTRLLAPGFSELRSSAGRVAGSADKYDGLLRALEDSALGDATAITRLLDEKGIAFRAKIPDGLATFKINVAKLCPDLRLTGVESRGGLRPLVWFQERNGKRIELDGLSHSSHQAVLFAFLFAALGLSRSIVLIDTPELHIHPADHVRFFQALCELGTDNQIIAATTSPAILASVAPEQIIDLSKPPEKAA